VTFFQKGVHNAIHRSSRNGNRPKASKAWRGDADDAAGRIDDGSPYRCRLEANVNPDVWNKRRTDPRALRGSNEADDAKSGNRSAGTSAPYHQYKTTWPD